jgi:hypothetical protein
VELGRGGGVWKKGKEQALECLTEVALQQQQPQQQFEVDPKSAGWKTKLKKFWFSSFFIIMQHILVFNLVC